jgi:hypothetical protein
MDRRIEIVEATVAELVGLGVSVERRTREDVPRGRGLLRRHARP